MKVIAAMTLSAALAGAAGAGARQLTYPEAPKGPVTDNYFGLEVVDTYRPLEDDRAEATLEWVRRENAVTRAYLDTLPGREAMRSRLEQLLDYRRTGMPWRGKDGRYYLSENDGLQPQSVVYVMDRPDGPRKVFLDPNKLSDDGTVALTGLYPSPDGSLTAYTIARNGSDWNEIYVMDTATGRLLDDHLVWVKFTGVEWLGNDAFFYSAYPRPAEGDELKATNEGHNVYRHRLGTPQESDTVEYADAEHPFYFHSAEIPEDSGMLFISIAGQGLGNALKMRPVEGGEWTVIAPTQDKTVGVVTVKDGYMVLYTNIDAERYRLMKAPLDAPAQENWTELVPEQAGVLSGTYTAGDKLVLIYTENAVNHIDIRSLADGSMIRRLDFPGMGTFWVSTERNDPDEMFFAFNSFTSPSTVYRHSLENNVTEKLWGSDIKGFNPDDYVTEQVWVTSKDGTQVPMFITYRRDLRRDGNNPVYLMGYGGFNITQMPTFSAGRLAWLENGGIYAQANLRGGGEFGEAWHKAGTKMEKQNVFDDFIACGEWLVSEGWTRPGLLAIEGGSNGGLLIGACVNQRPDLWAVAVPRVGVMDMMRYHLFTIGWNWAPDYGRSDDSPEMAAYLLGYSPLHNISDDGTPYPAILVTTADHDDRVVPAHSFKYAAQLQASDTGSAPKLIRIDSNAGHGAGKSTAKTIDELTDIYTFILNNLRR